MIQVSVVLLFSFIDGSQPLVRHGCSSVVVSNFCLNSVLMRLFVSGASRFELCPSPEPSHTISLPVVVDKCTYRAVPCTPDMLRKVLEARLTPQSAFIDTVVDKN